MWAGISTCPILPRLFFLKGQDETGQDESISKRQEKDMKKPGSPGSCRAG
jgi:hypothetical protein